MARISSICFGLIAYATFLGTILYMIGFVFGAVVPKDIDQGPATPTLEAVIINLLLLSLFALQHSVMARRSFKQWWTRFIPHEIERSVYVLLASLVLILLAWQWRPIPAIIWRVADPAAAIALSGLALFGWLIVLFASFQINHFELFGLKQVFADPAVSAVGSRFKTPFLYRLVRHPLYLGFIIAFWSTPTMTAGHFLFAAVATAYIFVGASLEERDLIALFGDQYRQYRERVAMLVPWPRSIKADHYTTEPNASDR
ncbi:MULTISPECIES: methanethiol S-methyltransferase [Bradyrhizobium]|uniref:methanethiol S-methyltransferase n=1 Tax=Bradyrhizobium elkanii TaxID=29448 RepID=UPI000425C8BD